MDIIRSCYRVPMRFYKGLPNTTATVQWYFVPQSNGTVPFPNLFASRVWDVEEELQGDLGETFADRTWCNGKPPFPVSNGLWCGRPDQWSEGSSVGDPPLPVWSGTAVPRCCPPPPETGYGGIAIGGLPVVFPCCGDFSMPRVVFAFFIRQLVSCDSLEDTPIPLAHTGEICPLLGPTPYAWGSFPFVLGGLLVRIILDCQPESVGWNMSIVLADFSAFALAPRQTNFNACSPLAFGGFIGGAGFSVGSCNDFFYAWDLE
jgi:hypothetical protein